MKAAHVFRSWARILQGYAPALSIEITKECPLRCPGCYAYEPNHLGGEVALRQLSDFRGEELVRRVLQLVEEARPLHVSLVGGDPLVRYRELEQIVPALVEQGIHVQVVTSAFRPLPASWREMPRTTVVVSIDGLQEEHDMRRAPATYERILKNIRGSRITVHCTITRQMLSRENALEPFPGEGTGAVPRILERAGRSAAGVVQHLHAAEGSRGGRDAERGGAEAGRARAAGAAGAASEARHGGERDPSVFGAAAIAFRVHFCEDDAHGVGGPQDSGFAVPAGRRSGLRAVRLHRGDGTGGGGRLQGGRTGDGGRVVPPVPPLRAAGGFHAPRTGANARAGADSAGDGNRGRAAYGWLKQDQTSDSSTISSEFSIR